MSLTLSVTTIIFVGKSAPLRTKFSSISTTEISHGIKKLKVSQLVSQSGVINKEAATEFLVHGLKYIFPPEFGTLGAGVPTAYARPGFKYVRYNQNEIYV